MALRLQKALSRAGFASRRAAELLISAGRVTVNGEPALLGQSVEPEDVVLVDGRPIAAEKLVYIVLNKPTGYITTAKDAHARHTVMELVEGLGVRVFPVGRLDKDTEGLLLFTNDGELTNLLLHPSCHVEKTYLVEVEGRLTTADIQALESGLELYDGLTAPAKVSHVQPFPNGTRFRLTIHEGRNRQVRRMCGFLGRKVLGLRRISLGPLNLGDLAYGHYRHLTDQEITALYNGVKR